MEQSRRRSRAGRRNTQWLLLKILHEEPKFHAIVQEGEADLARIRQALEERERAQADL